MKYENIVVEQDGPLLTIQFNRPEQYNAINEPMMKELLDATIEAENDPQVRALMITGSGKSFNAGGDIKAFLGAGDDVPKYIDRLLVFLHGYISRLVRMPKPVIGAVNGVAAGAGLSLAMACDLVVARADATFTVGYTKIGASPDGGSTFFLSRLLGLRRVMDLTLTNRLLTAEQALEWGLVSHVFPVESFLEQAKSFAMDLANGPTFAFGKAKQLIYHSQNHELEAQMELEGKAIVEASRSEDFREGIKAFAEKRAPKFSGH